MCDICWSDNVSAYFCLVFFFRFVSAITIYFYDKPNVIQSKSNPSINNLILVWQKKNQSHCGFNIKSLGVQAKKKQKSFSSFENEKRARFICTQNSQVDEISNRWHALRQKPFIKLIEPSNKHVYLCMQICSKFLINLIALNHKEWIKNQNHFPIWKKKSVFDRFIW